MEHNQPAVDDYLGPLKHPDDIGILLGFDSIWKLIDSGQKYLIQNNTF